MNTPIRRIVTGHNEQGLAVVEMDSPAPNSKVRNATGLVSTLVWVTDETPAKLDSVSYTHLTLPTIYSV